MHATQQTLSDLAARIPAASRVFRRHGLDFCCHGRRPLAEACAEKRIDAEALLAEIDAAEATGLEDPRWDRQPTSALIAHLVDHHHASLREELPELIRLAARVETRHDGKPGCPLGLGRRLQTMHAAIVDHLDKEEAGVFPLLAAGRFDEAAESLRALERDHRDVAEDLATVRRLTDDLNAPPHACTTWRALYLRLDRLESDLMDHIHLENNVLFPRALGRGPEAVR